MSSAPTSLPTLDEPGDAELISAVRAGDVDAYGELFRRHVEAARRLARQLVSSGDADDLVSEAFAKVLGVLQRGGGPDLAFRAYLLTAVRRLHVDRIRATSRLHTTDDLTPFDPGVPFRDTAVEGFESGAAARAFASLPERWQLVLWHTEVEGQKPAEIAPLLGMSANSVAALAYRAREGLREAFLSMHVQEVEDGECTWVHRHLGAYVRGGVSRRDTARIEGHLTECRPCAAIYLELTEVNSDLSGLLAPLLLGGLASGYLASASAAAGGAAAKGGALLLLDRARDLVGSHGTATAVAGATAAAVVAGAVLVAVLPDSSPDTGGPTAGSLAEPAEGPGPSGPSGRGDGPRSGREPAGPAGAPAAGTAPGPGAEQPADPDSPPDTAPDPTPDPTPAPDPDPPPDPPDPPDPPEEGADLSVTASARATSPATYEVVVVVLGVPAGGEGTLSVSGDPAVVLTADGRCGLLEVGSGTCAVTGSPATYAFTAVAPAGSTLTFTVTGEDDPDPSDNRTTVRLS